MDKKTREKEGLFRLSIIGPVVNRQLKRGELRPLLQELAEKTYTRDDGSTRNYSWRTLEKWVGDYRRGHFDALLPQVRKDQGTCKALPEETVALILDMKREDPGRSAPLIRKELILAGVISPHSVSTSTICRILRKNGLSGPQMELTTPARYRWSAANCNALWQGDALHGPRVIDPATGRKRKAIIFGLIDDKSRLAVRLWAGFKETQEAFLATLYEAMARRGIPHTLLLDNHGSFIGHDVKVVCAKLKINLNYARPRDGAGKGHIERFWRTVRKSLLGRLDYSKVKTLDDLNLRITTWYEEDYNHSPHSGLAGSTPMSVWEKESDDFRWVHDYSALEALFTAEENRKVLNDSTISFRGKQYEVPTHLRRQKVVITYSVLNPSRIWVIDADTEVPITEVDPEGNATRARKRSKPPEKPKPKTGLNAAEMLLDKLLGRRKKGDTDEKAV